ncbi:MAG: carbamoyl-phosphate synthase small subunit [Flavobacteriales bacterium]|jgi:carbamoyl-phosphate synthase small subunit
MKYQVRSEAVLVLEDGTVFFGKSVGIKGTATGEVCFNTGMTGYQEVFTDPSYYGQIMVTTNAHIGNYGVHKDEVESKSMKIAGLVCKNFSETYSRTSAEGALKDYFESQSVVVISDVDTRALVRHIRDKGVMNVIISSETMDLDALKEQLKAVPSMDGLELASKVTTETAYEKGDANAEVRVAVLDLGVKESILRCFLERDCLVKVFPKDTKLEIMLAWDPDGIFLSNGPGDPSAMPKVIEEAKRIMECGLPIFGICMGHQIISLANGIGTFKMHNGHRGINHPILNHKTRKGEITSQNHGFAISREEAEANSNIEITHTHLNDQTVAGIKLKDRSCFSVQYHPEASPGPHDSRYLFDQFVEEIKLSKKN